MLNSKYLLLIASLITVSAYADKLDKDGILRSDRGYIHYMNQDDAMTACPAGTHLPTIRELAEESQARGAKGILETTQVKDGAVPADYYLVEAKNPDGKEDKFYFNSDGYNLPQGNFNLESNWFWSSSSVDVDGYYDKALVLLGGDGDVDFWDRVGNPYDGGFAVRCVVGGKFYNTQP